MTESLVVGVIVVKEGAKRKPIVIRTLAHILLSFFFLSRTSNLRGKTSLSHFFLILFTQSCTVYASCILCVRRCSALSYFKIPFLMSLSCRHSYVHTVQRSQKISICLLSSKHDEFFALLFSKPTFQITYKAIQALLGP